MGDCFCFESLTILCSGLANIGCADMDRTDMGRAAMVLVSSAGLQGA